MARLRLGNGSKFFSARSSFILISAVLTVVAWPVPWGPAANAAELVPVAMDVIVALDISDSMGVTDGGAGGNGDRLSAAKELINNLVAAALGQVRAGALLRQFHNKLSAHDGP